MITIKEVPQRRLIQVFEHQKLAVEDQMGQGLFNRADFDAMCRFASRYGEKYFQVLHDAVRFKNYVGVIQVGALTIEVLPKADKKQIGDKKNWQDVLLGMLRVCRFLKPEQSPGAKVALKRHMLFDLYIELFLDEVEQLLRQGVLRQYQAESGQTKALKGRLIVREQMRKQYLQKDKFYCRHNVYTFAHPLNQVLGQALHALKRFALPVRIQVRLHKLLLLFPQMSESPNITQRAWDSLRYNRKTERYRSAIDFAFLILLNYNPDVRFGRFPMVALLFDMNLLFEEYIYQKLAGFGVKGVTIRRQDRAPFWHRSHLQPDLVLVGQGKRIVIDTKWKLLKSAQPGVEDLRQLFAYGHYFGAEQTILLYPAVDSQLEDFPPTPFALTPESPRKITCQVCFAPILKDKRLNPDLGKEILQKIGLEINT